VRVERWFAFVDLSGFTSFGDEFGDDESVRVLTLFRSGVRRVATDFGVRIAKWLGDGCMIVCVDQEAGIAAALDLEAKAVAGCAPLSVRVGVATGYALLFEGDDYIGSAVNLAARLCDAAGPGELLMPADQIDPIPAGVIPVQRGKVALRGFPVPIEVVLLTGMVDETARHDTGELWTRSPFVG